MVDDLADVLERARDHPHEKLDELEPAAWANLFAEQRQKNVLKRDAALSA